MNTTTISPSLPISNASLTIHDCLRSFTAEKRIRNRSLCSLLLTPPLYPGYSAKLEKSTNASFSQLSRKNTTVEMAALSNPMSPYLSSNHCHLSSTENNTKLTDAIKHEMTSSQIKLLNNDDINWNSPKKDANSKESSGYSSGTSESEFENEKQLKMTLNSVETTNDNNRAADGQEIGVGGRPSKRAQTRQQNKCHSALEKSRRGSVPAYLRNAFSEEIVRVLEINGVFQYETDADTGLRRPVVCEQSINRPESVLQLARKFAEASAAQDKEIYILNKKLLASRQNSTVTTTYSSSGPNSLTQKGTDHFLVVDTINKKPGGIACLYNGQMSKVNIFKQMDQIHGASQSQVARPLNPSSIKSALLRWCQYKLQDYPIQITNFSSCWADGMAFCALIHRFVPDSFDYYKLNPLNRRDNLELAFKVAEQNGIVPLLEVDDMLLMGDRPDWKCIFTYVQSFYKEFKDRP